MKNIYNYEVHMVRTLDRMKESDLTEKNKKLIFDFYNDCKADGLTIARLIKLVNTMTYLGLMYHKDFDGATIESLKELVRDIDEKLEWKAWTKSSYKAILKKFFKWLKGNNEVYPPEVRWMNAHIKPKDLPMLSSDELLTDNEIQAAIDACDHPRNKAFISVLAESGCRIGEIGNLKIMNVGFDKHGTILTVKGKTGSRRVRVIKSTSLMATWINNHPFRRNPDAPLWINVGSTNNRNPMRYGAFTQMLRDAFRRAGISKRCNPHLFRHSRASKMAKHMTEFQMNHYFGWKQGSDMPSTYIHLSGKDLDDAVLKLNGVKTEEKEEDEPSTNICSRCEAINTTDSMYCSKCGNVLDEKTVIEMEKESMQKSQADNEVNSFMSKLLEDSDVKAILMKKMLKMNL